MCRMQVTMPRWALGGGHAPEAVGPQATRAAAHQHPVPPVYSLCAPREGERMTRHPAEPQQHASAAHQRDLEALAREAQVPIEEVTRLYAHEWAALTAGARITTFLSTLTTRKVRAILRHGVTAARRSVDTAVSPY